MRERLTIDVTGRVLAVGSAQENGPGGTPGPRVSDMGVNQMNPTTGNDMHDNTKAPLMSPASFCVWLDEMRAAGIATSDAAAGRALGISPRAILDMKARGTDRRTALACAALLAGIEPFTG